MKKVWKISKNERKRDGEEEGERERAREKKKRDTKPVSIMEIITNQKSFR